MINRMSATGLMVDLSHFAKMEKILTADMDRITEEVFTMTGHYVNIDSGDQVSDLLFKKLKLKQIRPKLTKSGDRESVDDEVLTAIQHEHPVVSLLLEYKEYSKLRGTYVVPMPKLARRVAQGEWRMFPNFGCTRIPSGRLNCKDPNLLAMPNRTDRGREVCEGFITKPGWVY
ncbi:MAG: DNA polymerase, partial [Nitrospiraceae bacterium]